MRKIRFFYFGLSFIVHCFSDIQLLWRKHEIGKNNMICSDMFTIIRENRVPLSKRSYCFSRLFLPDLPGLLSLAGIPVKSLKLYLLNTSFCDQSETCVHILFLINFSSILVTTIRSRVKKSMGNFFVRSRKASNLLRHAGSGLGQPVKIL